MASQTTGHYVFTVGSGYFAWKVSSFYAYIDLAMSLCLQTAAMESKLPYVMPLTSKRQASHSTEQPTRQGPGTPGSLLLL